MRRVLLAFASALLCQAAACRDLQVVTHSFASMAEARREGAVERGWLPALVPPGAYDIREAHDEADSGRRWGLFSFQAEDAAALRSKLGPEMSFRGQRAEAPPRIEWWPVQLRGMLDADLLGSTGLTAYPVMGERLVAAVNWNQRRAYYWSPR
jgi:hypothetical protein